MAQIDSKENSVVAVYPQHSDAENAINLLKKADFNIKKLAILGQGYHTEDQVVGYYTTGDRMKHWGKQGAFWGGLWVLLVGSAFFIIPGSDRSWWPVPRWRGLWVLWRVQSLSVDYLRWGLGFTASEFLRTVP